MKKIAMVLGLSLLVSLQVQANEFVIDNAGLAKGGQTGTVLVGFSGSGNVTDAQIDLTYDAELISAEVKAMSGASCVNNRQKGIVRVVSPDFGGKVLSEKATPLCKISLKAMKGSLSTQALKATNAVCAGALGVVRCGNEGDGISQQ